MIHIVILLFLAMISSIFSVQAFSGKDIILDNTYLKATEEEKNSMDKKAYRIQAAIIFLFIAAITVCNALRAILRMPLFTYLALFFGIVGIVYAIISHYTLKRKNS